VSPSASGSEESSLTFVLARRLGKEPRRSLALKTWSQRMELTSSTAMGGEMPSTAWEATTSLSGRAGGDLLCGCGGGGSDRLIGGTGVDELVAYGGKDFLIGGPGSDVLRPGEGHDRVFGRAGDDDFHARDGIQDLLFGGRGTDIGWLDRRLDITTSIRRVRTR
jgi:RTX calcium-binding nonapeptide repeat (4 copies)